MRRPEEDHRPAEDARRDDDHRDDADRRDQADRHDDGDHRDADRDLATIAISPAATCTIPSTTATGTTTRSGTISSATVTARDNCRWGWAGPSSGRSRLATCFSYAWWPYAGPPAFWDYGLNVILTGLFWPNGVYKWPQGYGAYAWPGDGGTYQVAREAHQNVYSGGPANAPPPSANPIAQPTRRKPAAAWGRALPPAHEPSRKS